MSIRILAIQAALTVVCGGVVTAQQVVQLPSFRTFSYSGSVLVPDQGTAFLGGNRSSAFTRGGISASVSGLYLTPTIIDTWEMDRQILGYEPTIAGLRTHQHQQQAAAMAMRNQPRATLVGSENPESIADTMARVGQCKSLVRAARRAVLAGDTAAARATYREAIAILDRLRISQPVTPHDDPAFLAAAARQEFFRQFPAENFGMPTRTLSRGGPRR